MAPALIGDRLAGEGAMAAANQPQHITAGGLGKLTTKKEAEALPHLSDTATAVDPVARLQFPPVTSSRSGRMACKSLDTPDDLRTQARVGGPMQVSSLVPRAPPRAPPPPRPDCSAPPARPARAPGPARAPAGQRDGGRDPPLRGGGQTGDSGARWPSGIGGRRGIRPRRRRGPAAVPRPAPAPPAPAAPRGARCVSREGRRVQRG
jgi:hypothetical protein